LIQHKFCVDCVSEQKHDCDGCVMKNVLPTKFKDIKKWQIKYFVMTDLRTREEYWESLASGLANLGNKRGLDFIAKHPTVDIRFVVGYHDENGDFHENK